MASAIQFHFLFAVLLMLMSTHLAATEAQPDVALCKAKPNDKHCFYVLRYEEVREYKQPTASSQALPSWGWGRPAQIDWSRAEGAPAGWLPTWAPTRESASKRVPYGWIEIRHLARLDEFRRVTGCWPVAYLEDDDIGEYLLTVKFTTDGRAVLRQRIRTEVLFAPNVILLVENGGYNFLGFDPKTRLLRQPSTGKAPQKVRYFPSTQLIGCDEGLKLQN